MSTVLSSSPSYGHLNSVSAGTREGAAFAMGIGEPRMRRSSVADAIPINDPKRPCGSTSCCDGVMVFAMANLCEHYQSPRSRLVATSKVTGTRDFVLDQLDHGQASLRIDPSGTPGGHPWPC
jgi:hypothetical protein